MNRLRQGFISSSFFLFLYTKYSIKFKYRVDLISHSFSAKFGARLGKGTIALCKHFNTYRFSIQNNIKSMSETEIFLNQHETIIAR